MIRSGGPSLGLGPGGLGGGGTLLGGGADRLDLDLDGGRIAEVGHGGSQPLGVGGQLVGQLPHLAQYVGAGDPSHRDGGLSSASVRVVAGALGFEALALPPGVYPVVGWIGAILGRPCPAWLWLARAGCSQPGKLQVVVCCSAMGLSFRGLGKPSNSILNHFVARHKT